MPQDVGYKTGMPITEAEQVEQFAEFKRRRRSSASRALLGDLIQFIEFLAVIAISVASAYAYHVLALGVPFDFQYYTAAGIIGATGLTALLRRDGYYDFDQLLSPSGTLRAIVSRWILVVLGLIAFGFALKISENFSRAWLFAWSAAVLALVLALRWAAAKIVRAMIRSGGVFARRIAIVGATELAEQFSTAVGEEENGISIVGVFDGGPAAPGCDNGPFACGDLKTLEKAARDGAIDDIVIAAPTANAEGMAKLVRRLSILPVSVSICPQSHWLDHRGGAVTKLGAVSVLSLYRRPLEGWGGVIKVIEDYVLGAVILIALSPIMLLIAAAIKLQDRGPVLFAQQRHGFNNSVFRIYKFRTMTVLEDGDEIRQAQVNDPRITPLGRVLRRYSLDELPQLLNVVTGTMSLVGPRPHALAHNHQYAQMIENYSGRHKVKPGITGWAQVNGYRGETSENELMEERVRYDLAYIDNWSLWFDFKILVMTAAAVVFPKNAV
ncbi:MAG: undecaprenyl-phosphate glucose phosphotransferase [Pseudomonadota bacterium]